jgi:hypothetical protein
MAEYKERTGKCLPMNEAKGTGVLPEVPEWCLAFANTLLNGSLSHVGVKPSKLKLAQIQDIAINAFTAKGVEEWSDRYFGVKARPVPPGIEISLSGHIDLGDLMDKANAKKVKKS